MQSGRRFVVFTVAAVLCLVPPPVSAETDLGFRGWGLRVGVASDPDQVIGGVHFDLGQFVDRVRFEPNAILGVGDDHTVIAATAAAHYLFSVDAKVRPYAGVGLGVSWIDRDDDDGSPPFANGARDDDDIEIDPQVVGGLEWRLDGGSLFKLEASIGLRDDVHDARVVAGWTF